MRPWARFAIIPALLVGGYIMAADFVNLRRAALVEIPTATDQLPLPQPWGGYAWHRLSRFAGDAYILDPATARNTIAEALVRYPIDATAWLDAAEVRVFESDLAPIPLLLEKAFASQPFRQDILWRSAQLALQTQNFSIADDPLRRWLTLFPNETARALFIGSRWIEDPDELIDRILPPGREFLEQAMAAARQSGNAALAEAVWARLESDLAPDDPAFLDYAETLLRDGELARAVSLWQRKDPDFAAFGISNAEFSNPLGAPAAFNWDTRAPAGVSVDRDLEQFRSAPASLRVAFNGKENVRLTNPSIHIPIAPGQHYRLSGFWRAERLTTRALPYLQLDASAAGRLGKVEIPATSFDWHEWVMEFQAPSEGRLAMLRLRRDATDNFDRNIGGTIWLDDLRLEAIEPDAPAPPIRELLFGNHRE